jgi:hypothetical protein
MGSVRGGVDVGNQRRGPSVRSAYSIWVVENLKNKEGDYDNLQSNAIAKVTIRPPINTNIRSKKTTVTLRASSPTIIDHCLIPRILLPISIDSLQALQRAHTHLIRCEAYHRTEAFVGLPHGSVLALAVPDRQQPY